MTDDQSPETTNEEQPKPKRRHFIPIKESQLAKSTAAILIAEDLLTDVKIAERVGINLKTLGNWKRNEHFAAKVLEYQKAFADRALKHGLANKEIRLHELDKMYADLKQVIRERGSSEEMKKVPGGTTGLICKTYKGIGINQQEIFEVDNPTIKQLIAIHEQYAQELGQKIAKMEVAFGSIAERMEAAEERLKNRIPSTCVQ